MFARLRGASCARRLMSLIVLSLTALALALVMQVLGACDADPTGQPTADPKTSGGWDASATEDLGAGEADSGSFDGRRVASSDASALSDASDASGAGLFDAGDATTPPMGDAGARDAGEADVGLTDAGGRDQPDAGGGTVPPEVYFYDNFEYDVSRDNEADVNGTRNAFVTTGGWQWVKSVQFGQTGAKGYLYTTNRIPGYGGAFPGVNSRRVLALEAKPRSMYDPSDAGSVPQTDFYLQYGNPEGGRANAVPADVWFQFWLYVNHYDDPTNAEDQLSQFDGGFKWIYPCNRSYPCTGGNLNWLFTMRSTDIMLPEGTRPTGPTTDLWMTTIGTGAVYAAVPQWNAWKLGHNLDNRPIASNQWTLVRLHFDTSSESASYEAWIRPRGAAWVRVAQWREGETSQFSWPIPAGRVGGHRGFRMPTTMGDGSPSRLHRVFDTWMYLDDFAMATDPAALPSYPE